MCQLASLEVLSLAYNQFTTDAFQSMIPMAANLKDLTTLNLAFNQLTAIPSCVAHLPR